MVRVTRNARDPTMLDRDAQGAGVGAVVWQAPCTTRVAVGSGVASTGIRRTVPQRASNRNGRCHWLWWLGSAGASSLCGPAIGICHRHLPSTSAIDIHGATQTRPRRPSVPEVAWESPCIEWWRFMQFAGADTAVVPKVDVLVAGLGPGGCAAAMAAHAEGLTTLAVEGRGLRQPGRALSSCVGARRRCCGRSACPT